MSGFFFCAGWDVDDPVMHPCISSFQTVVCACSFVAIPSAVVVDDSQVSSCW